MKVFAGSGLVVVLMNSRQLRLSTEGLHKTGPIHSSHGMEEETMYLTHL